MKPNISSAPAPQSSNNTGQQRTYTTPSTASQPNSGPIQQRTHTSQTTVTHANTARTMGSGTLDVFATPAMIALMENAAVEAVREDIPEGSTTVGTLMNVAHLKASKLGESIQATATLTATEGRKLTFHVEARDSHGTLIGEGTHERFIVDIVRFLAKL